LGCWRLSAGSFAFRATQQTWSEDRTERSIQGCSIDRGDVSIVTMAANANATASLRAEDLTLEQRKQVAERVGNRVGGPYPTPDVAPSSARRKAPRVTRSYVEEARRKRAHHKRYPGGDRESRRARTQTEVDALGAKGEAHKALDGSGFHFPVVDRADLLDAIKAVNRARAGERPSIRKFLIARAKALGLSHLIPSHWEASADRRARDAL
jgi:hypothetical protein